MVRLQLKSASTVGQILDILKFSVKMLVVEKSDGSEGIVVTTDDVTLLKEIFHLMPENFSQDPVKVRDTKSFLKTLFPWLLFLHINWKKSANKTVFNLYLNNKRVNVHLTHKTFDPNLSANPFALKPHKF